VTPLELCQDELVATKTPTPDFLSEDLTPATAIYWGFEAAKVLLTITTAAAASLDVPEGEEQPVMTEALNGVAMALTGYTYALVQLEVLPEAALLAIRAGTMPETGSTLAAVPGPAKAV
jgi:hypothetical protein